MGQSALVATTYDVSFDTSHITYQPGISRDTRLLSKPIWLGKKSLNWWLCARSREEAEWLDRYGFPSPSEEQILTSSTVLTLKSLASKGDLNAQAHLATRSAKDTLNSSDWKLAEKVIKALRFQMIEGGPYAALKTMASFGELLDVYSSLPASDQTEYKRKILQEYYVQYEFAYELATAYGDHTAATFYAHISIPEELGTIAKKDVSDNNVARLVTIVSAQKLENGLPSVSLMPRPLQIYAVQDSSKAFKDMSIILERL